MQSTIQDDFDYPIPKRQTNWTLENQKATKNRGGMPPVARAMNRTDDIPGATTGSTSLYKARQFTQKPDLFKCQDIQGAAPKKHTNNLNKPKDTSLNNRDIDHSFPESKLFSTPRIVDPLNPVYPLPKMNNRPPTPTEKKHESLKITDIDGTRPKPKYTRSVERNPLDYSDIPYSTAGSHLALRKRKSPSMALETQDIKDDRFRSHRSTNPLDPVYTLQGPMGVAADKRVQVQVGNIDGSKPREPLKGRSDQPLLSLKSDDIDGAKPGSHVPYPKDRRHWKSTCDISDIQTKGRHHL